MKDKFDILLIEDEEVVSGAARRILNSKGFDVDSVDTAEAAFKKLEEHQYRLILSDLMLPGMSGIEFLSKVKGIYTEIPVIIITGYASLANAVKSFKAGAFDFIPKPFDFEELAGVVYRAMKHVDLKPDQTPDQSSHGESTSGKTYCLGHHSWARLDKENFFIIGVGETFASRMGTINSIDLPPVNDEISQGNLCAQIISEEYLCHMVWAPLSGKIVSVNQMVKNNLILIDKAPENDSWLLKIVPTNLEKDLENLALQ